MSALPPLPSIGTLLYEKKSIFQIIVLVQKYMSAGQSTTILFVKTTQLAIGQIVDRIFYRK